MLGLELYEAQLCGTCGVHPSRATTDHIYDVTAEHCLVCAGLAVRHRQYGLADSKEEEALKARPEDERASIRRDADGRKLYLREVTPEEAARLVAERAAAPVPAASPAPPAASNGPRRAAEPPKEG
ncbi:hypothetical protein ACFVJS_03785 [Nocardioides sp. NPDC057772]|uniref:hypothetical protein n=1 Tax=Nocardioides sp. NPDC057772 TaxID=3346245 RepID=UPI00366A933A